MVSVVVIQGVGTPSNAVELGMSLLFFAVVFLSIMSAKELWSVFHQKNPHHACEVSRMKDAAENDLQSFRQFYLENLTTIKGSIREREKQIDCAVCYFAWSVALVALILGASLRGLFGF